MTNLREAAQMALDALEHGLPAIEDFGGKQQIQLQHKAIAALYEALPSPPQREWQGLTQEEVRRIVQSNTDPWCDTPETDGYGVAEMVESKLREKNGNF
jgi:hypothetical protein